MLALVASIAWAADGAGVLDVTFGAGEDDGTPAGVVSTSLGKLRRLGEDVTEELEYVPGRFIVNRIVRPRMACSGCDCFTQAPLPSRPVERGRPGPGLLAHVLVNKYADHLPLYRQSHPNPMHIHRRQTSWAVP